MKILHWPGQHTINFIPVSQLAIPTRAPSEDYPNI
eukprot:CAMPEP_0184330122 /NCGR_PEP_ID=MMETSP1049-20130417/144515_1 /TAXON_ID=77928 /ORGANISM="Proteomonas sulcata, Strain CCMP704" /LENGTH=34 /DNA_ID= /DNA_START= /DNA_END= /DNA_ORIENTATION=